MNRSELVQQIQNPNSLICIGLDRCYQIPGHLERSAAGTLRFNKAIDHYQGSLRFLLIIWLFAEAGVWPAGRPCKSCRWQRTFQNHADAKRGDIGNTSDQYAGPF